MADQDKNNDPQIEQQITTLAEKEGKDFISGLVKSSSFMFGPALQQTKKELIDLVNEKLRTLVNENDSKVENVKQLVIQKSSSNVDNVRQELTKVITDRCKNLESRMDSKMQNMRVEIVKEVMQLFDGMEIKITGATLSGTFKGAETKEKEIQVEKADSDEKSDASNGDDQDAKK